MSLTEERKQSYKGSYKQVRNTIFTALQNIWDVSDSFEQSYCDDYQMLQDEKVCFMDKYTVTVFSSDPGKYYPKQPIPDYIHWLHSNGELHYLDYQERNRLERGPWDTCALFLPSHVLDVIYKVLSSPPQYINKFIALLVWVPECDVEKYYKLQ